MNSYFAQLYAHRNALVERICEKYGDQLKYNALKQVLYSHMRWLPARNLSMCFIAKVIQKLTEKFIVYNALSTADKGNKLNYV